MTLRLIYLIYIDAMLIARCKPQNKFIGTKSVEFPIGQSSACSEQQARLLENRVVPPAILIGENATYNRSQRDQGAVFKTQEASFLLASTKKSLPTA
ncbi:hypothetical protein ACJ72_00880 [Emergomyces africanus]|uniref:Uncharacterized protein n=1 Tax=Emergomyces africanus TaxID=1955775 RepID=A0A1B7P6V7_9EURO|nr:hypothetical protein ACJ72_00880 [Emergomyces africanus]